MPRLGDFPVDEDSRHPDQGEDDGFSSSGHGSTTKSRSVTPSVVAVGGLAYLGSSSPSLSLPTRGREPAARVEGTCVPREFLPLPDPPHTGEGKTPSLTLPSRGRESAYRGSSLPIPPHEGEGIRRDVLLGRN